MSKRITGMMAGALTVLLLIAPCYAFRENIVGAWLFDEGSGKTVKDYSGNGNDGEIQGNPEWVDGKFGKALHFDGKTYVLIPFKESMKVLNESDFTIAAWFKSEEIPPPEWVECVFQQGDKNGVGRSWLYIHQASGGGIHSFLGGKEISSDVTAEEGKWYHAAVVAKEKGNSDEVQIFVDGEAHLDPTVVNLESSEGDYFIGAHKKPAGFFIGIIDEVVLINKALSKDEIKELMTSGVRGVLAVQPKDKLALRWGDIKR